MYRPISSTIYAMLLIDCAPKCHSCQSVLLFVCLSVCLSVVDWLVAWVVGKSVFFLRAVATPFVIIQISMTICMEMGVAVACWCELATAGHIDDNFR